MAYVLENNYFSITFAKSNGCMISILNKASNDNYLKNGATSGLFCAYVDPPGQNTITGLYSSSSPDAALWWMKRSTVDQSACQLTSWTTTSTGAVAVLMHPSTGLRFTLTLQISSNSPALSANLVVQNTSSSSHTAYVAFPHVQNIQLGASASTNLGITNRFFGVSGVPAWQDIGGIYPLTEGTQMQSVWETSVKSGFSALVLDSNFTDKMIRRNVGGMISFVHYMTSNLPAASGSTYPSLSYPTAQVFVHSGDWRVAADVYGAWLRGAAQLRPALPWFDEVSVYTGRHCSDEGYKYVRDFQEIIGAWLLGSSINCLELAMYSTGEESFQLQSDGIYEIREDMGGAPLLKTAIQNCHSLGRYVTLYVAALHCSENSPLMTSPSTNRLLYAHMSSPGVVSLWPDVGYVPMCVGFTQWQDQLASVCRKLLQDTGADGIRLDQLPGAVPPCFNPQHNHPTPIGGAAWVAQLLTKVRAAMDTVNPNSVLLTEYGCDHHARWTNGALVQFVPGAAAPIISRSVPDYNPIGYHTGAIHAAQSALLANGADEILTTFWDSGSWFLPRPSDYPSGAGNASRFSELQLSLKSLMRSGRPVDTDPLPQAGFEKWVGRTWIGANWVLVVGGAYDGKPLTNLRVAVYGVPTGRLVSTAVEIDATTLQSRQIGVTRRTDGSILLNMTSSFSAVLLMSPGAPALITASPTDPPLNPRGVTLTLSSYAPWNTSIATPPTVNVRGYGFTVTQSDGSVVSDSTPVKLPATLTFSVNSASSPRYFPSACMFIDVMGSGVVRWRRTLRGPIYTENNYISW